MGWGECSVKIRPRRIKRFVHGSVTPEKRHEIKPPSYTTEHCDVFRYDPFSALGKVTWVTMHLDIRELFCEALLSRLITSV